MKNDKRALISMDLTALKFMDIVCTVVCFNNNNNCSGSQLF